MTLALCARRTSSYPVPLGSRMARFNCDGGGAGAAKLPGPLKVGQAEQPDIMLMRLALLLVSSSQFSSQSKIPGRLTFVHGTASRIFNHL